MRLNKKEAWFHSVAASGMGMEAGALPLRQAGAWEPHAEDNTETHLCAWQVLSPRGYCKITSHVHVASCFILMGIIQLK